ncbi:hypothetical protein CVU37_08790 [candidate division BRC1 bacterium HGW-BRC1-1]|nr:MAG: hypothetical protein CVU37_08790 [candidate division BRC1 bacterium HGW-BRC1-1]
MRLRLRLVCSALLCWVCVSSFAQTSTLSPGLEILLRKAGWVQIGLQKSTGAVAIQVKSGAVCMGPSGKVYDGPGGTFRATADRKGINLTSPDGRLIQGEWFVVEPRADGSVATWETSGNGYRGRAQLVHNGSGMRVINQIRIDDYLKGVLPAEIGSSPMEALKAQAVAARSETIFKLAANRHKADGFDLCTGEHCQAYKGVKLEEQPSNEAVDATAGYVLTNASGAILDAVYSNVCGGITAGAEDVWDSEPIPGLRPVFDSPGKAAGAVDVSSEAAFRRFLDDSSRDFFCDSKNAGYPKYAMKYFRWKKTVSGEQLAKVAGFSRVRDVAVAERRPSGKVWVLRITGDGGVKDLKKELPIRRALDLWSGLFYVDVTRNPDGTVANATFTGGGNGHGVGLCQMGARTMAARGMGFDRILNHYYPDARVVRVYRP